MQFGYESGTVPRINSRTDRRGFTTTVAYDAGKRVRTITRAMDGTTPAIVSTITALESKGVDPVQSITLGNASTDIDGPRTDVADIQRYWLNRVGLPTRIRNAVGRETVVMYGDVRFPALATTMVDPVRLVAKASYNGRGLIDSTKVLNPLGDGQNAVTRFMWHSAFAKPTAVTDPTGVIATSRYSDTSGVLLWSQPGNDSTKRVAYDYYAATSSWPWLYRASIVPGRSPTERDSIVYDMTLGNYAAVSDRKAGTARSWVSVARDVFGRVYRTTSPISPTMIRVDSTLYDEADQVRAQVSIGQATTYAVSSAFSSAVRSIPAERVLVTTLYDEEGNVLGVQRSADPDTATLNTIATTFTYDGAGRKLTESSPQSGMITYTYDASSNVVTKATALGTLAMKYDAANRPLRTVTPQRTVGSVPCSFFGPWGTGGTCLFSFPLSGASSLVIEADTATFAYDPAGRLSAADNRDARIRRRYYPNGALWTDSLRIRNFGFANGIARSDADFSSYAYGIHRTYDPGGRQLTLSVPTSVRSALSLADSVIRYRYAPLTGLLDTIVDARGQMVSFHYTASGQVDTVRFPGGVRERVTYDPNGLILQRAVGYPQSNEWFIDDALEYDQAGRVRWAAGKRISDGTAQTIETWRSGLGNVVAMEHHNGNSSPRLEEIRSDALGNQVWTKKWNYALSYTDNPSERLIAYDNSRRALSEVPASIPHEDDSYTWYDGGGNTSYVGRRTRCTGAESCSPNYDYTQEAHYYRADGKLARFERHAGTMQQTSYPPDKALEESYRYDALGRRVMVVSTHQNCTAKGCENIIQRFVWDGDNMLSESRTPFTPSTADIGDGGSGDGQYGALNPFGVVAYTHAGGIDRPLGVIRSGGGLDGALWPHGNWRGLYEGATREDGALTTAAIRWAGVEASAYLGATPRFADYQWAGSLITEHADQSGLLYRRHRYYDPSKGQFTQPDPIGLAGGLNAYGYANGDPITYSDPFGLCPIGGWDALLCNSIEATSTVLGSAVGFTVGGGGGAIATVLTGGLAAPVVPAAAWAGAGLGAAGGLAIGKLITNKLYADKNGDGGSEASKSGAQDKKLSQGEIQKLKDADVDIHELKGGKNASKYDLYKDSDGNILVKPKRNNRGQGEPTGLNINDF